MLEAQKIAIKSRVKEKRIGNTSDVQWFPDALYL